MRRRAFKIICVLLSVGFGANLMAQNVTAAQTSKASWRVPGSTKQLVVGLTSDWNASTVTLRRFEKVGRTWKQIGEPFPGRVGVNGLVWGRGLHPRRGDLTEKVEGDGRAPAGAFVIGRSYGYDALWQPKTRLPYVTVGPRDLLVEDPSSPLYNKYVRLDHEPITEFEKKQQMKQSDPMHRLKITIEHNTTPAPVTGKGSAILFHIWRANGAKPTAGCTSVSDEAIEGLMTWLDPAKKPIYVLLPTSEYEVNQGGWNLPRIG